MLHLSLLGHLGAGAERRSSQKGAPMATFRIVVKQVKTDADGERPERAERFWVWVMGRLTECAPHLIKGGRVLVMREGQPPDEAAR